MPRPPFVRLALVLALAAGSAEAAPAPMNVLSQVARYSKVRPRTYIPVTAPSTRNAAPACSVPTVTTAVCSGPTLRETMVCRAITMPEAATTGSAERCGKAPWPPTPVTVIFA